MKPLVMGLEPELPGLEVEYRQKYLKRDIDQGVIGILLWGLPSLAFAFSDFVILGPTSLFYNVFVLRVGYLLLSLLVVFLLRKKGIDFKTFERLVLLWSVSTFLWNIVISLIQPQNYLSQIIIALVGVFAFYVFIPNPFTIRVIPPLIYSIYVFLMILLVYHSLGPALVEAIAFAFLLTNLVGILFSSRVHIFRRQEFLARHKEEKIQAELTRLATTDPLTGVMNRRRLLELAGEVFYRYKRYRRPFSIMIMDLDGFKNLNDTLGHQQGDLVLIQFAEVISSEKREADALGRMGGDEFCLIMPETIPQSAIALANRIIKRCEDIIPGRGAALKISVTVSIGISEVCFSDRDIDPIFSRADAALYKAKNDGRNRLEIYPLSESSDYLAVQTDSNSPARAGTDPLI